MPRPYERWKALLLPTHSENAFHLETSRLKRCRPALDQRSFAVDKKPADLLKAAIESPSISARLRDIAERKWPVCFSHIVDSAQPFLVAGIAKRIPATTWVLCPN